jgi:hypothetical protein
MGDINVESTQIVLTTTMGDIDVELWPREAPQACRNFVQLCLEERICNVASSESPILLLLKLLLSTFSCSLSCCVAAGNPEVLAT